MKVKTAIFDVCGMFRRLQKSSQREYMPQTQLDNYLRSYRKRAGLFQNDVAYLLGSQKGTEVSRYERDHRQPNLDTILALEVIYRVPASMLFAGRFQKIINDIRNRAARLERRPEFAESIRKRDALAAIRASRQSSHVPRVLAIDPTTRGFAYAVFEGPERILDWGRSEVRPQRKNALCLKGIEQLLQFYAPTMVIVEDCSGKGSRRWPRVQKLIHRISALAADRRIRCRSFSRAQIQEAFGGLTHRTKHSIASEIAQRYPHLAGYLPRVRRFFEGEDPRMNIFDATALALTLYAGKYRNGTKQS